MSFEDIIAELITDYTDAQIDDHLANTHQFLRMSTQAVLTFSDVVGSPAATANYYKFLAFSGLLILPLSVVGPYLCYTKLTLLDDLRSLAKATLGIRPGRASLAQ